MTGRVVEADRGPSIDSSNRPGLRLTAFSLSPTIPPRLGREAEKACNFPSFFRRAEPAHRSEWPRMAEPTPPHSVAAPARAGRWRRALAGLASLALILQVALALRVVAADLARSLCSPGRIGTACVSSPTRRSTGGWPEPFARATPYEYVEWSDIPHFALRTPGYPLFLAGCQARFRPADAGGPSGPGRAWVP